MIRPDVWVDPVHVTSPPPALEDSVALDMWWLAHDSTGRLLLSAGCPGKAIGIGLAAGLLADLAFRDRFTLRRGVVQVVRQPPVDPLAQQTFAELLDAAPHLLSTWLDAFAVDAYARVAEHLVTERLVAPIEERRSRLSRRADVRYAPLDHLAAAAPGARLTMRLERREPLGERDALLLTLAVAVGLRPHHDGGASRDADQFGRYLTSGLDGIALELALATRTAMTRAVLAYRS